MPLDPCFEALLADRRIHLRPPAPPVTLADLREGGNRFMCGATGPEVARVDAIDFDAADGRRIRGRAYRASVEGARPAILFFHGGGFVFGDLDTHDAICRMLAVGSGCTVLAVDYRLAPEHPFPAAVDDCTAALLHVARAPGEFGVRPRALAVAGDSAGAHVAIGVILGVARAVGATPAVAGAAPMGAPAVPTTATAAPTIAHVALLYPVIDPRCDSASMQQLARGYMLTREGMQWFWQCYLQREADRSDPRVDVSAPDLAGFPPTTVVTAEFDPLRDEGELFARRLAAAGVRVRLERQPGMIHGFAGMPQLTPVAGTVVAALGDEIGRALGAPLGRG